MPRCAVSIVLTLGIAFACCESARACGDKFLVPGRVPQFNQAFASQHPGRILMYRNASSEVARAVMDDDLQKTLKRVGHVVDVVESSEELDKKMSSGTYDLVLADVVDIENLSATEGGVDPVLLPVVYRAPWAEVIKLKETYHLVVNAPSRASQVLSVIDEALNLRRAGG